MKNLLKTDIETLDNAYRREHKNCYRYHSDTEGRQFYHYLERFLEKHVGHSYNKSFQEFKKSAESKHFPPIIWGMTWLERWNDMFNHNGIGYERYTVTDGIIRHSESEKQRRINKRTIKETVYPEGHRLVYKLIKPKETDRYGLDGVNIYRELVKRITEDYGEDFVDALRNGISEKEYIDRYENRLNKIYRQMFPEGCWYNEKFKEWNYPMPRKTKWGYVYPHNTSYFIIKTDLAPSYTKIKEKPKKDKSVEGKNYYETQAMKRKAHRERTAEREYYAANLLAYLETEKKTKEKMQNIVDRDRLGFDENSFIGEGYHGQQRKKKK